MRAPAPDELAAIAAAYIRLIANAAPAPAPPALWPRADEPPRSWREAGRLP